MTFQGEPVARPGRGGRSDRFAAVVIFLVSSLYIRYALTFQPPRFRSEALGPATFPLMIGGLMVVCSVLLFVESLRRAPEPPAAWRRSLPALALWGLLLAYSVVLERLGFPLATALFLAPSFRLLGVRPWWRCLLYAVAVTAAAWYAFAALDVRLPRGEWWRR
ncbi:MAG: tripartite tricarboxylate transporter TctB family protein [Armatimonadota bacterium]|nr:tripartite tricarboxylate transporter TctB family protein [Armatimonadota bacterium]MDR7401142.1 tripartite tricarboxylate transporter TctB family protein [Armatimonadota bacterium]MDR7403438.1 tripartite tricarboxylate transporter TctB family protein [Armatimonadota bacterium]MDR7436437.1 tripartite tricarboxylate transporter TctB family protein [Armatimonadota bacterium]MDR7471796.1 tripartite tricarboxylate transporter TctB family protein [Armatimonadota bacterium]